MSNPNNETIKKAIQYIVRHGIADPRTGALYDSKRTTGFVAKIHDDPEDELYGTIDVEENQLMSWGGASTKGGTSYHEGVQLSALQNNNEGYLIVPKLFSEVTFVKDPHTNTKYVTMFSHVDLVQLDSHDKVTVRVREREPFEPYDVLGNPNEDADDIDELECTGNTASTTYTKNMVTTQVFKKGEDKPQTTHELTQDQIKQAVGEDDSLIMLNKNEAEIKNQDSKVAIKNNTVYVGSDSNTDDGVLGQELASILSDLMTYLGNMMTPTMMGPQPPTSSLANFMALKAKVQNFAASHSGFLTQKVKIQK